MKLTSKELNEIANKLVLTHHAEARIDKRSSYRTLEELQTIIRNSQLGWKSYDDTYKIRLNFRLMAVIAYCPRNDKYAVMTVHNGKGNSKYKTVNKYYEEEQKTSSYKRTQALLEKISQEGK